jgi:hypothetical protein
LQVTVDPADKEPDTSELTGGGEIDDLLPTSVSFGFYLHFGYPHTEHLARTPESCQITTSAATKSGDTEAGLGTRY